jgi:uncharacterized protein YjbJ (UPF0337 family)
MNPKKAKRQASKAASNVSSSAAVDKAKGHVKEVVGTARANVGRLIGNEEMEVRGNLQHADGSKDLLKADLKDAVDNAKDKVRAGVDLVKEKVDDLRKR